MPSRSQLNVPSRGPLAAPAPRPSRAGPSNEGQLLDTGLGRTGPEGAGQGPTAPAPQERDGGGAQQQAAGGLDGARQRLDAGDIEGAAADLRQLAAEQRRLIGGGGDRAVLQAALAALAVTESLLAASTAKTAGRMSDVTRHADTAVATLGRSPMLDAAMRKALLGAAARLGARGAGALLAMDGAVGPGAAGGPTGGQGYDAALGQALARASAAISGGNRRAGGNCYARVADAVDAVVGRFLTGGHAYMAASQLAARKSLFTEVPASNLSSLPAGAIVVWGKGTSDSGHISVALGDGRESSDFVGPQMTSHYGGAGARVFLPRARMSR